MGSAYRTDLQGLRALAVSLVLVFHLWPALVTGGYVGVDAFFVISGYLITLHLLEHPPRSRRDLLEFWGRRIRRLLPAAFLVLASTAVATRLLAPPTQWGQVATEVIGSAAYVENWLLAGSAVDYLAASNAPTPVQHFWSLAVEEQFYVFWPVLVLVIAAVAQRRRASTNRVASLAFLGVIAASLAISAALTAERPASAYFITPTRIWELAIGGFLATISRGRRAPRESAIAAGVAWLGVMAIVVAAAWYDRSTQFPGVAALLPVLGTAAVIGAYAGGRWSPDRVFAWRPVQYLGDISYSVYLWHWPLIVLAPAALGALDGPRSIGILVATVILAALTKRFVEDGVRFSPRVRSLRPTYGMALTGMALVIGVGAAQLLEVDIRAAAAREALARAEAEAGAGQGATSSGPPVSSDPGACFGANAIARGFEACPQDPAGPMIPAPEIAKVDKSDAYADDCWTNQPFRDRKVCTYGTGPVRVALVGNSHAGQWLPALQVIAQQHGWTITTFLASQCNTTDAVLHFESSASMANCPAWAKWVEDQTGGSAFDLVITAEKQAVSIENVSVEDLPVAARAGYTSYLQRWAASGAKIVVIRDTPNPGGTLTSIPDCLAGHPQQQDACDGTPASWYWMDPLADAARALGSPAVSVVDMSRYFCVADRCPAVIGSVIVYFDASHVTATYARTLGPYLATEIGP